jgi:uncharacterized protein (TIGR03437 family)
VAAKPGDEIEIFALGFGPTNPAVPAGRPFSGAAPLASPVQIRINNIEIVPEFVGLTSAGLYQINLRIPSGFGAGDLPLAASVSEVRTPSTVVISLQ